MEASTPPGPGPASPHRPSTAVELERDRRRELIADLQAKCDAISEREAARRKRANVADDDPDRPHRARDRTR